METHQLSFAKIIILRADIAEVIVNDGVELTLTMINEYHRFLLNHLSAPFSILVNKINAYSYTFEAQTNLACISEINAMAVVAYSKATELATRSLATTTLRKTPWNMEIFSDKQSALHWLENQQQLIEYQK
jgi:hypothetical protein